MKINVNAQTYIDLLLGHFFTLTNNFSQKFILKMENEWISVCIYNSSNFEHVIVNLINNIVVELERIKKLKSYFFIRYWEPEEHLRLRILPVRGGDTKIIKKVILKQSKLASNAQKNEQPYRLEFTQYKQETDRYGGVDGMKISEKLFEYSSKISLAIIKEYYDVWTDKLAISSAIKMHAIFIRRVVGCKHVAAKIFKEVFEHWLVHSIKLNEHGQITMDALRKVREAFELAYNEQKGKIGRIINDALVIEKGTFSEGWEKNWDDYSQYISGEINSENGIAPTFLSQFIDSHIHMSNNRLGVHLRDESFISFILYKVFYEKAIM